MRAAFAGLLVAALCLVAGVGTAAAAPPTASVDAVNEVSYASAHFEGTVENASAFNFQVSTDGVNWSYTNAEGFPSGEGPQPADATVTGLQGGTKYFVRLVAFGETSVESSPPYDSFTTLPVEPPTVLGVQTDAVDNHTATFSGSVKRPANPDPAFNVNCRFEYITDANFQARDEKQQLAVKAGGGTYALSFSNPAGTAPETTVPIVYNASAATVQAALQALPNIGAGNVTVSGGPGNKTGAFPYVITFAGALAAKNLEQISDDPTNLAEPGGAETIVLAEGHAEGFDGAGEGQCKQNTLETPGTFPVEAKVAGLAANTTYHLRLSATNAGGTTTLVAPNFTTTSTISAQTLAPNQIATTAATIAGRVNGENAPLTYQFEWGTTPAYGNLVPAAPESLGTLDEAAHVVAESLTGLAPGTVYHYRIVATNTQTGEVAEGEDQSFQAPAAAPAGESCPNETSRVGNSAGLPDCRAIEFASPGLNGAGLIGPPYELPKGASVADGSAVLFIVKDSPLIADSSAPINFATAERSADGKWITRSFTPPLPTPATRFFGVLTTAVNEARTESLAYSTVSPSNDTPAPELDGQNGYLFYRHADGTWERITDKPTTQGILVESTSANFKHFLFFVDVPQYPGDTPGLYEWSTEDHELRHPGILPNGALAVDAGLPFGGTPLDYISADGETLLFLSGGQPYLRIAASETKEIAASQRATPDPVAQAPSTVVGITTDGSRALFISKSELTEDANTGVNDAGADLYSYDVADEKLTDLTVDENPADADTGADVRRVVAASHDGSYIYFVAGGKLAPGGISGEGNLYVLHGGEIRFIAPAEGLGGGAYVTPDGTHLAFLSTASLTGYNNENPQTNTAETMAFKYSYGGGLECASCRPDGTRPVGSVSFGTGADFLIRGNRNRALSADGSRMFFQSTDKIVPQAANKKMNVFEYTKGEPHLLSPGNSEGPVFLLDASVSGDDVFITANEELALGGEGSGTSIYDVRVNADVVPPNSPTPCSGENCRGAKTTAPASVSAASTGFEAPETLVAPKAAKGKKAKVQLRVYVPSDGQLRVSGSGLKTAATTAGAAGFVTIDVGLKHGPTKVLRAKGVYKSTAELLFTPTLGEVSRTTVALRFEAATEKRGK